MREAIGRLEGVKGVKERREGEDKVFELQGTGIGLREAIGRAVGESGGVVTELREERRTLEDVFAETVKRPERA